MVRLLLMLLWYSRISFGGQDLLLQLHLISCIFSCYCGECCYSLYFHFLVWRIWIGCILRLGWIFWVSFTLLWWQWFICFLQRQLLSHQWLTILILSLFKRWVYFKMHLHVNTKLQMYTVIWSKNLLKKWEKW